MLKKNFIMTKSRLLFLFILLLSLLVLGVVIHIILTQEGLTISPYPNGKNFAFTITADPDYNKLEHDKLIYNFIFPVTYDIYSL